MNIIVDEEEDDTIISTFSQLSLRSGLSIIKDCRKVSELTERLGIVQEKKDVVEENTFLTDEFEYENNNDEVEGETFLTEEFDDNNNDDEFEDIEEANSSFINYVNENMDESEDEVLEIMPVPKVKLNTVREKPHAGQLEESSKVNRKPRTRRPRGKFNYLHFFPQEVLEENKTGRKREVFNIYNSVFCKLCKKVFRKRMSLKLHNVEEHQVDFSYDNSEDGDNIERENEDMSDDEIVWM